MATRGDLTVGNVTTSTTYPWPNGWDPYPVYPTHFSIPAQDYANEMEVERGEHDAVLRFYRSRGGSRSLVKEITVPLGVLNWLIDQA